MRQVNSKKVSLVIKNFQCDTLFEKIFITMTPANIKTMHVMAGISSCCLNSTRPITEIRTMPTPDHMA